MSAFDRSAIREPFPSPKHWIVQKGPREPRSEHIGWYVVTCHCGLSFVGSSRFQATSDFYDHTLREDS